MRGDSSLKAGQRGSLTGYAFISPWLLGFAVFTAYPFLSSVYLSFTRYNIYNIVTPPSGSSWLTIARC